MSIKISSRKNKGRLLQKMVMYRLWQEIGRQFDLSCGIDGDISSREMGQVGTDIRLSPRAKEIIKFDVECKCQESLNIWSALKQCEDNSKEDRIPMLVFKRNRSKVYAVIEFDKLLELIKK